MIDNIRITNSMFDLREHVSFGEVDRIVSFESLHRLNPQMQLVFL